MPFQTRKLFNLQTQNHNHHKNQAINYRPCHSALLSCLHLQIRKQLHHKIKPKPTAVLLSLSKHQAKKGKSKMQRPRKPRNAIEGRIANKKKKNRPESQKSARASILAAIKLLCPAALHRAAVDSAPQSRRCNPFTPP
jgi:hypothetical protein